MYIANDDQNRRIHISETSKESKYYCPLCGYPVMRKNGEVRAAHFAHMKGAECDDWHNEMSEWHRTWQEQFPIVNREIVIEKNGEKHRADVLINNTVIEFQHSSMTFEEFEIRNQFYNGAGYRVVWLFDYIDQFEKGRMRLYFGNCYEWLYAKHTFDKHNFKNQNVFVFFQLSNDENQDGRIIRPNRYRREGSYLDFSEKRFDSKEFVSYIENDEELSLPLIPEIETQYSISNLVDPVIYIQGYYYPCVREKHGYNCFENCDTCEYSYYNSPIYEKGVLEALGFNTRMNGCIYKFKDIIDEWNEFHDRVINIQYDNEYRITSLELLKNNEKIIKRYIQLPYTGKTIWEIIRKNGNYQSIGVKNIRSGMRVKLKKNRYSKSFTHNNAIYGFIGKPNEYGYYNDIRQVYYANKPEWIVEWTWPN